ncbi:MAG: hypothetical protein ACR2J4_09605 [Deinococcus sp.]
MKVRWTSNGVRLRLDDLEVGELWSGRTLEARLEWPGGGWSVTLDPGSDGVQGEAGRLKVGLRRELPQLLDPRQEGVTVGGVVEARVEKDYRPEHLG